MLKQQPSLWTERLRLRPFVAEDAEAVSQQAGRREVAETSLALPHPYSLSMAKSWIAAQTHAFRSGASVQFAGTIRTTGELIGSFELRDIDAANSLAELQLWVGVPSQRSGLATEGARELVRFGLDELALNRIHAFHLARDPVAGSVLRKLGFKQEGVLRQRVKKWGEFEDVVLYALLREGS